MPHGSADSAIDLSVSQESPREIARRITQLGEIRNPNSEISNLPDLVIVDGGKGQLNAALAAFRDCDLTPPVLVSLAKRDEEIYLPGEKEPLRLGRDSFALRLLQYVRDEAHRFAQHYHHLLRSKRSFDEDR